MTKIEQCARFLATDRVDFHDADTICVEEDGTKVPYWSYYVEEARTFLRILLPPDAAMVEAGFNWWMKNTSPHEGPVHRDFSDLFTAMIEQVAKG